MKKKAEINPENFNRTTTSDGFDREQPFLVLNDLHHQPALLKVQAEETGRSWRNLIKRRCLTLLQRLANIPLFTVNTDSSI